MILLLCSRNDSVRSKWLKAVGTQEKTYQAASVDEMRSLLKQIQVDIILLHRSVVDRTQLRDVCLQGTGKKIFVLADRPEDEEGLFCLQLGCVGYANTHTAPERLAAAIDAVGAGLVWVGSSLMQYLIKGLGSAESHRVDDETAEEAETISDLLSDREYQIAGLVAEGLPNSEIAERLQITERTVKAHLSSVYGKTQTKGRLNLALLMKKLEGSH